MKKLEELFDEYVNIKSDCICVFERGEFYPADVYDVAKKGLNGHKYRLTLAYLDYTRTLLFKSPIDARRYMQLELDLHELKAKAGAC